VEGYTRRKKNRSPKNLENKKESLPINFQMVKNEDGRETHQKIIVRFFAVKELAGKSTV
jgi:hypothetical protein